MLLRPVFADSHLGAWTGNIAHGPDIGGMVPGSMGSMPSISEGGASVVVHGQPHRQRTAGHADIAVPIGQPPDEPLMQTSN